MITPLSQFPPRGVLFLSTEVYPYAKTGGLADVSSALPQALRGLGHDVRVMMPKYGFIGEKKQKIHLINRLQGVEYNINGKNIFTNLKSSAILTQKTRIQMYMLESDDYFGRMGLYVNPDTGQDYPDNDERFLVYALSAFELCKRLMWKPDIIHCNDWQCGLVPAILKSLEATDPFWSETKSVFTIHNLAYQGNFPASTFPKLGLPQEFFTQEGLEYHGNVSYLKSGIAFADAITTVSETYAEEIRTPEYGCGMDGILSKRKRDLFGILNGIDLDVWDPDKDVNTVRPFSLEDLSSKEACKEDLCSAMSIPYTEGRPIMGMIARFSDQKGFDLVAEIMDDILKSGAQLVILGEGDKKYADLFTKLRKKQPDQIGVYFGFHDNLAHKIEAGSDIFLMPSAYEPCGLNQMYSMHYGTIPVVRKTGGLADTVIDLEADHSTGRRTRATGFTFEKYDSLEFWKAVERAINTYSKDKKLWADLQANGMKKDFSWDRSAVKYAEVYEKILNKNTKNKEMELTTTSEQLI